MAMARHEEIVAIGRDPISPDRPVGDPCRYDDSFEELQAQLDRIGSLTGEEVDWARVVDLATNILKSKSKDLLVMTYLTVGLFEHHGYAGLAAGLESYCEFLKNFWENCFPKVKPPHGRYNAVQFMADRIVAEAELKGGQCKKPPGPNDTEAVHKCAERTGTLLQTVDEVFKELPDSPNLAPLNRAFQALKTKVGPIAPPPGESPAVAAPGEAGAAPAAGAPTAAPAAGAVAVPESFATATQATQAVVRIAKYLLAQDNKDARAYRLIRSVHFGGLGAVPKDGLLPPVPPQRRQFFEKLATDGNWPDLLNEAEGQFVVTPLWLDLQRFVATALDGLGPAYATAHSAVVLDTVALHKRLPELFDLNFKDRTPFADGATKAWLEQVSAEFGGGGGGGGDGAGDALGAAINEARKLLTSSKHAEAVTRMTEAIDSSGERRQRFRAQLALARLFLDMNRLSLAIPLLEQLEQQIERYQLEEWEPGLAAEALGHLFEALRKAKPKPTPEDVQRANEVFGHLCRLNPAAAMKLDPSAKK
ncbi:MAG: type VI secretion system protein TssA [Planctomycetota bacterium]